MAEEIPKTRGKRKKLKMKLLKNMTVQSINPAREYENIMDKVLGGLGRFIQKSGFCPTTKVLAQRRTWLVEGTQSYLEELLNMGLVDLYHGKTWNVTAAGWQVLGFGPFEPKLPPEMTAKVESMKEARSIARRLADPEVAAAYEAFFKEKNPGVP